MGIIYLAIALLALATASQGRQCYRNGQYYNPGQSWVDSSCTFRCNCYQGGRYKCSSLCYGLYNVRCGYNEVKKYRKAPVAGSPQCQCDQPYCVKKPPKQDVCYDNGKRYTVGQSYIDSACKWKCTCNKGGRRSCRSVCLTYSLRCASNKIKKMTKISVPGSRCQCDKPVCVNKPKIRCYYGGRYYNAGSSWIDSACKWRCNCDRSGRHKCSSLCTTYYVSCGSNQRKINKRIPVAGSSRCTCNRPVCVNKPSKVCKYQNQRYNIGDWFVNNQCTSKCNCKRGGRAFCKPLCPSPYKRCGRNQIKKIRQVQVGYGCSCAKPFCVNKPKKMCRDGGKTYSVGDTFINAACNGQCTCKQGGRVSCSSLCRPRFVRCGPNQVKITKKVTVSAGSSCQCDREVCQDKQAVKCSHNGQSYNPGRSWVDSSCKLKCKCNKGGSYKCSSLCHGLYNVRCGYNEITKYRKASVAAFPQCQCDQPYCVKKDPNKVYCNFRGELFPVGQTLVDRTCKWSCKCNPNGIYNCVSACVYIRKTCPTRTVLKVRYEPVKHSKTCRCKIPYCARRD